MSQNADKILKIISAFTLITVDSNIDSFFLLFWPYCMQADVMYLLQLQLTR